jgi:hypothetical protein
LVLTLKKQRFYSHWLTTSFIFLDNPWFFYGGILLKKGDKPFNIEQIIFSGTRINLKSNRLRRTARGTFERVDFDHTENIIETIGDRERNKVEIIPPDERGLYYRVGINKGKPMPVYSMVEALDYLRTNWKDLPFDTIAIDTVDKINEWQEKMTKERFHIEALADLDFGKGWTIPKENQLGSIASLQLFLRSVSGSLVMTSHSKNTITVDKKVQLVPDIPSGVGKGLCKIAEVIGFTTCNKANGKYYVSFLAYEERNIGSRLKPLAQKRLEFDYKTVINEIKSYKEK